MRMILLGMFVWVACVAAARAVPPQASALNALTSKTVAAQLGSAWIESYREGLAQAQGKKMPVLIDFRADWCGPCKMMESRTFPDPQIMGLLDKFVCVRVDVDKDRETAMNWRINGIPRLIVLNRNNQVIMDSTGFTSAKQLAPMLEDALAAVRENRPGTEAPGLISKTAEADLKDKLETAKDDALTSAVVEIVAQPDPEKRKTGLDLLLAHAERVRPVLLQLLGDARLAVRVGALEGLHKLGAMKVEYDPWLSRPARMDIFKRILTESVNLPGPVVERAPGTAEKAIPKR